MGQALNSKSTKNEASNTSKELKSICGAVERVIFSNAENGYVVFVLNCDNVQQSVTGNIGEVVPGETLTLKGEYVTTAKWGEQFQAVTCERVRPDSPVEIAKYLASGIVQGVGAKTAENIVKAFGSETLEIIEKCPEKLRIVKGVTIEKAIEIGTVFRKMFGANAIMEFLSEFGVSPAVGHIIWNKYESSAVALIKENPYILCAQEIGVSFDVADAIAGKHKLDPFSATRITAGIAHSLLEGARSGHTCVPYKQLKEDVTGRLDISGDAFDIALYDGAAEKQFCIYEAGGGCSIPKGEYVYLPMYLSAERYIVKKLTLMQKLNPGGNRDFTSDIERVEEVEEIRYESLQKAAIQSCLEHNLFILTGGPGTGKTTTLNAVIRLLKQSRKTLSLAAPTGRAAKRMSELTGQAAQTIHRLLEVDMSNESMPVFSRNESNPLAADVIIIDEMSMVDTLLFEALLRAVRPEAKLIMAGDSDQLPSVGAGNILADLISCGKIEQIRLIEIFRQAQKSLIVTNAHKIVSGFEPDLNARDRDKDFFFMPCEGSESELQIADTVVELVKTRLPNAYGFDPFEDIQVLTPTKMGAAGTRELNKRLQLAINPPSMRKKEVHFGDVVFRVGDKVMQTANDYNTEWLKDGERGSGVYNGDIGVITALDTTEGLTVNFDGRVAVINPQLYVKLEHAYAITVHKSQGSEYKAVILPVSAAARRLLYRSLLYTGVTRARDLLILLGRRDTVAEMIRNERITVRWSCLRDMLG